jgi:soluble lytic murein transglycosylase-like protein
LLDFRGEAAETSSHSDGLWLPMRRVLVPLFAVLILVGVGDAWAGSLYRCVGKDGVTAFTSTRVGFRQCKLVGSFPDAPRTAAPAASAASGAASGAAGGEQKRVEFRTATAGAEPKTVDAPSGSRPRVARGAIYKYVRNGVTHYTNRRPVGQRAQILFTYIETCFACSATPGLDFSTVALNLTSYADEVQALATEHGVDAALVRAIIHAESAFNPNAVSRVGAQGLMQLMPATARRFGVDSPFVPQQNIRGGVTYLAWLLKRFDGDVKLASAGYNAGEGAVDKYDGVPPYSETLRYVERVAVLHGRYQTALATAAATAAAAAPVASTGGGAQPAAGASN